MSKRIELRGEGPWIKRFVDEMSFMYKSFRFDCACLKVGSKYESHGMTIVLEHSHTEKKDDIPWESESLVIVSSVGNPLPHGDWSEILSLPDLSVQADCGRSITISIPCSQDSIVWDGREYDRRGWLAPSIREPKLLVLQSSQTLSPSEDQKPAEMVLHEVRNHAIEPYDDIGTLCVEYGIGVDSDFSRSYVRFVVPVLATITNTESSKSMLNVSGISHQAICPNVYLTSTIHWDDGTHTRESYPVREHGHDSGNQFLWKVSVNPAAASRKVKSVDYVLSYDRRVRLDSKYVSVGAAPTAPLELTKALDLAHMGGRIDKEWSKGSTEEISAKADPFEYYIHSLMNCIGIPTIWLGPYGIQGVDLLAFDSQGGYVLLIECTRGTVRKKASMVKHAMQEFEGLSPDQRFVSVVVTTDPIASTDRKDLESDGIFVVDKADMEKVRRLASEGMNGREILQAIGVRASGPSW